jgi:molybdopterin/thiamine biosynthesis adenylyltransferase
VRACPAPSWTGAGGQCSPSRHTTLNTKHARTYRTHGDLTKQPPSFYRQFNLIVCGLDSIEARRWMNRWGRHQSYALI